MQQYRPVEMAPCYVSIDVFSASHYDSHVTSFHQYNTLCPFAQEAHQHKPSDQTEEANSHLQRTGMCERSVEPLNEPHLSHTNPEQDTSAESVERSDGDQSRRVVAVEGGENADANRHAYGRRDRECAAEDGLLQEAARDHGNSGAKGKAFEDLVEEDNDEECDEPRVGGDHKSQSNYWKNVSLLFDPKVMRCRLRIEWKMMPASITAVFKVSDLDAKCSSLELASDRFASVASFWAVDCGVLVLSNMWRLRSIHL
jgi:hypothetical protein